MDLRFFESVLNQLRIYNESTGVPQLTSPQYGTYKVRFPSHEEQIRIADFLVAIDLKVRNIETKIDQKKDFKKGLLQQMFV